MPTINGKKGAYLQPVRFGFSDSGFYTVARWEGTKAEIEQMIPTLGTGATWEVVQSFSGAKDEIEVRFPIYFFNQGVGEIPVDDWEYFSTGGEKDILEADNALVESISLVNKQRILDLLQNPPGIGQLPSFTADGTDGAANTIYKLMVLGLRAVRVSAPCLRHTQTISSAYTVKAALTNVQRLISTASLATLENIPSTVLFNLPNDVSVRAGLSWAWYKDFPTIRIGAEQKMQIVQEWQYGLYAPVINGNVL